MKTNKGFTLIELMITVGTIGILTLIAMPFYQDYVKKVMIAEGLELASSYKSVTEDFFTTHGRCPISSSEVTISGSGNYVESITPVEGTLHWGSSEQIKICGITITYKEGLGLEAEWNANNYKKPALNLFFVHGNISTGHFGTPSYKVIDAPSKWICAGGTLNKGFVKGRLLPKHCYTNINYALSELSGLPEIPIPPELWN